MEETFCQRRAAEQTAADGTSTLTSDGYLRGITTEVGYVTLYPLKGKDLIQQAIVASVTILRFLGKLRMSHEAEGPRAVFDADNDYTTLSQVFPEVAAIPLSLETATMNPYQYRQTIVDGSGRCGNTQIETVLTHHVGSATRTSRLRR